MSYLKLFKDLYTALNLELEHNGETDHAETIRDQMDYFWFNLSHEEIYKYRVWISETFHNGRLYEEDSKAVSSASDSKE